MKKLMVLILIFLYGLDGALIAMVTNQSLVSVVLFLKIRKHSGIVVENFTHRFDKKSNKNTIFLIYLISKLEEASPIFTIYLPFGK